MCSDIWWYTYIKAAVQGETEALYGHMIIILSQLL